MVLPSSPRYGVTGQVIGRPSRVRLAYSEASERWVSSASPAGQSGRTRGETGGGTAGSRGGGGFGGGGGLLGCGGVRGRRQRATRRWTPTRSPLDARWTVTVVPEPGQRGPYRV